MDESPGELIKPAAGREGGRDGWKEGRIEGGERVDSRPFVLSKRTGADIRGLTEAG